MLTWVIVVIKKLILHKQRKEKEYPHELKLYNSEKRLH